MQKKHFVLLLVILILPQFVFAEVKLNALFTDRMVVQQNTKIPIWGRADPQEEINIETSWGASVKTRTNADSTWRAKLKTPQAGGPFKITVMGKSKIVLKDVLAGEVWLCSGQSNMDFAMGQFLNDAREDRYQPLVEFMRNEVATAHDSFIRHIEIPKTPSVFKKRSDFEADWRIVKPGETEKITATGYFFARELRRIFNVPVGIIECSWGGTRIQPWLSEEAYRSDEELRTYFEKERGKVKKQFVAFGEPENYVDTSFQRRFQTWKKTEKKTHRPYPKEHPAVDKQIPATLHKGMISAIVPFKIKGVLWYQGESNSHFKEDEYEKYFKLLIKTWRKEWGQGIFPFYWAQLAGYEVPDERSDLGWAKVNDHLRRSLSLPNTGMVVLHDIGEAKDVHPHNKMDVGIRFAKWALKNDYGISILVVSGPLYKRSKCFEDKIVIKFKEVGSGLMVGRKDVLIPTREVDEPLSWFQICGKDGIWKKANAKIVGRNKVEVSNPETKKPVAVRYAWSSNPQGANLYNREGLPAAVFTTEKK